MATPKIPRLTIVVPAGVTVTTTRRKTDTSSTVLVTVNKGTALTIETEGAPPPPAPPPAPAPAPIPAPAPVPPPPPGLTAQELDWLKRSTAPGVTFATDFRSVSDFTLASVNGGHVFAANMDPATLALVHQDKTDGMAHTNGCCLRIDTPAAMGANSAAWMFPLNRAWTDKTQGFGNQRFFIQFRFKIPASRLVRSNCGGNQLGWKFLNVAHYSQKNTSAESASNRADEHVLQDTDQRGIPQAYRQDGQNYPPFEKLVPGSSYELMLQTAVDHGPGLADADRYCLYPVGSAGCWRFPIEEWFTVQLDIRVGTYAGTAGNKFGMRVARAGDTQWTQLFDDAEYGVGSPGEFLGGLNGGHLLTYETNRINGVDTHQKWTQLIVATQEPELPMATATNDTYSAGSGGTVYAGTTDTGPLALLAASMPVGSWLQVTNAHSQDAVLGIPSPPGQSGSSIHYCNSMPWNPVRKCIEIAGRDHGGANTTVVERYMRFQAVDNAFVLIATGFNTAAADLHGYDDNSVNPANGDFYHARSIFNDGSGPPVQRWNGSAFDDLTRPSLLFYGQIGFGTCWWSGSFTGAGAQGCLLVFNSGDSTTGGASTDGGMYAFDPLANSGAGSWFWSSLSMAPNYDQGGAGYTYHAVMEYSAIHNCAVYGGGNGGGGATPANRKLWRLNSDRSVTAMPALPTGATVGIQNGNLVCDPVTGNFLLLSLDHTFWELDPTGSGTWTQLTSGRAPPAGVGLGTASVPKGLISSAIDDYGVVAYIQQTGTTGGTMFLYKHA